MEYSHPVSAEVVTVSSLSLVTPEVKTQRGDCCSPGWPVIEMFVCENLCVQALHLKIALVHQLNAMLRNPRISKTRAQMLCSCCL